MTDQTYTTSGVAFASDPDVTVEVQGTFMESGNQLHQVFIGLEPVLLVQPEFDADERALTLLLTTVDLPPRQILEVLEKLTDAVKEIVSIQEQQAEEIRRADEDFALAQLPETPEG